MTIDEANEVALHGAVARDDRLWQAQEGLGLTRVRAMSEEEAGSQHSLAWDRLPAQAMRTMAAEPGEGHDEVADRVLYW